MAQTALATIDRSAVPAIEQTRLFIINEWVDPLDGTCFDTLNPATGEVIASVAQGGVADIDRAARAARTRLRAHATRARQLLRFYIKQLYLT